MNNSKEGRELEGTAFNYHQKSCKVWWILQKLKDEKESVFQRLKSGAVGCCLTDSKIWPTPLREAYRCMFIGFMHTNTKVNLANSEWNLVTMDSKLGSLQHKNMRSQTYTATDSQSF